jgi:pilus assembly protein CpaD
VNGLDLIMRNKTVSFQSFFALVAVAGTLGGCGYNDMALDDAYAPLRTEERFPIEYAKGPIVLEVQTAAGSLQPEQVNAVAGFARQSMSGGLTPVTIRRPAGGGASARVAEEVAGFMLQQGLPRSMIRMGTYPAPANAPLQLSYVKAYAHTKPCGDWSKDATDSSSNEPMPNFGCAVQANIAAMLANPEDLTGSRARSPGIASVNAIQATKVATGASQSYASSGSSTSTTSGTGN